MKFISMKASIQLFILFVLFLVSLHEVDAERKLSEVRGVRKLSAGASYNGASKGTASASAATSSSSAATSLQGKNPNSDDDDEKNDTYGSTGPYTDDNSSTHHETTNMPTPRRVSPGVH